VARSGVSEVTVAEAALIDRLKEGLRKDPKEDLVRAADHVLETLGPQAATVRVITSLANTNTSAINYHFQSRENLLTEVGRRRMDIHNEHISERLARLEADGARPPSVEDIFRPLVETAFNVWAKDPVLRALRTMVFIDPMAVRDLSVTQVNQIYHRMLRSLTAACPHLPEAEIEWRYRLSMGTVVYEVMVADARMVPVLAKEITVERIISYITASFKA